MRYVWLLILLFYYQATLAQDSERIRTSFGIGGGLGLRQLDVIPKVQNFGPTILTYAGKPQPDWFGNYYAINAQGKIKEVQFGEFNADLYARFGIYGRNEHGWLFNLGYTFSRYSYSYDNPPFTFKGYTLSRRNSDFETRGFQFGIARLWSGSWFTRLSGLYFTKYTTGGFNTPINAMYQQNYTENGTGFLVILRALESNRFAVIPEIGLTPKQHPIEVSASVTIPLGEYAFAEQYSYYKNRQLIGGATATYSNFTATINVRLGFAFFKTSHKPRKIKLTPHPPVSAPEPVHRTEYPRSPATTRFAGASPNTPVMLLVYFDLEKADLKPTSFDELDELTRWLKANPTVRIRLEGHTDLIGDEAENMRLSQKRVVTVKDYLTLKGIASYRVEVKGYGETRPLNRNCPPPTYCPENRRVEMVILKQ